MSKLVVLGVFLCAASAHAARPAKRLVTKERAQTAYAVAMANDGKTRQMFLKLSGAAKTAYDKQVKRGGGSADTIVYRLAGTSAVAKQTAMIETDGESISYFTIVKRTNNRAGKVLATGYDGARGLLTWHK